MNLSYSKDIKQGAELWYFCYWLGQYVDQTVWLLVISDFHNSHVTSLLCFTFRVHLLTTLRLYARLLHSPNRVAVGLSVGYETCPPIGWHHPFVIHWSKCKLRLPQSQCIVGSQDLWEFLTFFSGLWQSPCTALTAGNLPAVSAVQGDCERV